MSLEPSLLRFPGPFTPPSSLLRPSAVFRLRFHFRKLGTQPLDPEILRLCSTFFSLVSGANPFRIQSLDFSRDRRLRRLKFHHVNSFWADLSGWKFRFSLDSFLLFVFPNLVPRNIWRLFSPSGQRCLTSTFVDLTTVTRLAKDESDFTRLLDPMGISVFQPLSRSSYAIPLTSVFRRIGRMRLPRLSSSLG